MMAHPFRALVLTQRDNLFTACVRDDMTLDSLPSGDVLVRVQYSALNYKDALAITNRAKVVRSFPMVSGIDLAGTVIDSSDATYRSGELVLLTGHGIGERHWGGHAQYARVDARWLTRVHPALGLWGSMALGTAGVTAMLGVLALEEAGIRPGNHPVLVTGATGGVGSIAIALLANLGYEVVAATGRSELHEYLHTLGAHSVVDRGVLKASGRPLETERYAGAIDAVGGEILSGILPSIAYGGAVAACGNAGGVPLNTTVFPFILRGVRLIGIDSVYCPTDRRQVVWERLATQLAPHALERIATTAPLTELPPLAQQLIDGTLHGRAVIDVDQ